MNREGSEDAAPKKEAKGKGKDVERKTLLSSDGQDSSVPAEAGLDVTSIVSRLGASANKLANDMIPWHPDSAHVADALSSRKAESHRAAPSPSTNEASSYRSSPAQAFAGGAFKSSHAQERYVEGESNFSTFLDGTSMPEMAEPANNELYGHEQNNGPRGLSRQMGQPGQTEPIVQSDGMDVVNLLNSGYIEVEEIDTTLAEDERMALRSRLFEDDEGESTADTWRGSQWENTLNFFPGSGVDHHSKQIYADLFGTADVEEAKSLWINQWRRVLSSYTDEVWGELSPLVSLAREEVSASRPTEDVSPAKLKALRRLQQILVHIRGFGEEDT
ncbi:hypothetical protein GGR52DRAFT_549995 [Hypoxylon sp. FL1284]|nr:hypothetical protein GGR52DRAFT_549995 [Hypoxylon sp. FL1284]